jgi:hypothetical protein
VCYFLCGPKPQVFGQRKKWLSKSNSWQRSFALLATVHIIRAARKHVYPTHNSLLWAEIRAPRLRQFVFCAFTCHPNGGISDFSIFIANGQKSIHFHLIIIKCRGREASSQSAAERHHGDDLQFVLSDFFALCAKNASRVIFSSLGSPL